MDDAHIPPPFWRMLRSADRDQSEDDRQLRPAFDAARRTEPAADRSLPERPPRWILPDPHPSFALPSRRAERLWFAPLPETGAALSRAEFDAQRTASQSNRSRQRRPKR